jgi:hypothetical protein
VKTIHSAAYSCFNESDQSLVKNTIKLSNIFPLFFDGFTHVVIDGVLDPSVLVVAAAAATA